MYKSRENDTSARSLLPLAASQPSHTRSTSPKEEGEGPPRPLRPNARLNLRACRSLLAVRRRNRLVGGRRRGVRAWRGERAGRPRVDAGEDVRTESGGGEGRNGGERGEDGRARVDGDGAWEGPDCGREERDKSAEGSEVGNGMATRRDIKTMKNAPLCCLTVQIGKTSMSSVFLTISESQSLFDRPSGLRER